MACSSDEDNGSGGDGSGGNGGNAGTAGLPAGGAIGCQGAEDCAGGQVCHPFGGQCVAEGNACSGHDECPTGMFCDPTSGTCLPGTTGSPCSANSNCAGIEPQCTSGVCGCSGAAYEQELARGPLDVYLIFDRTASMGEDCSYEPGGTPPVSSKACFSTYAFPDYVTSVDPATDIRLAFQFMSQPNDCGGDPYLTPLVDLTPLPIATDHALIQAISDETFAGGLGTHIEGALIGLAGYTSTHVTAGREMIGVLMTDGDPNGCLEDIPQLRTIIADHLAATGIRTFIIGMEGATDSNLEELGTAGGAAPHDDWCGDVSPPCHYWNVEDGSGEAINSALRAIVGQAAPLPCEFDVVNLTPPEGETLDLSRINVTLTNQNNITTTIGQVPDESACPADQLAWHFDNVTSPTAVHLCPSACNTISQAARVAVVVGCQNTVILQ